MNQTSRVVKEKCKFCGRDVYLQQEYDKTLSEYVTAGVPICTHCWDMELNVKRGVHTIDNKARI